MRLDQALAGCSAGVLAKIAEHRNVKTDVTTLRGELVQRLTTDLVRGSRDGGLWQSLDADERVAVALVAGARGRMGAELLRSRLARRLEPSERRNPVDVLLTRLTEQGVLFRVFEAESPARGTFYVVPDEYLESVGALSAPEMVTAPATFAGVVREARRNDVWMDCFILASALRRELWNTTTRRLAGGGEPRFRRLLAKLRPSVAEVQGAWGQERWTFLVDIGRRQGWLEDGVWPIPKDDLVIDLLTRRSLDLLWAAYLAGPARAEDRRLHGPNRPAGTVAVGLRSHALELLAELPVGVWHDGRDVAKSIADDLPPWAEGTRISVGPSPADSSTDGDRSRRLTRVEYWFNGPWFWLGLIEWGREADDWTLVAATALAAELVSRRAGGRPVSTFEPCRLDDSLELRATPTVDLAALYVAEQYLAYTGGTSERRYRLTAASFARGVRLGGSASEAVAQLERLAQASLPRSWSSALVRWNDALGRLRIDARVVLTAADAETLHRVAAVPRVADGFGEQLSERHVSISPECLSEVLQLLAEAGQPASLGQGLRLEPRRPERAALLEGDATELLWVLLEAVCQVDGVFRETTAANGVRIALEAVLSRSTRARLQQRAVVLAERLAARRDRGTGGAR